jgi:hypothetical protein
MPAETVTRWCAEAGVSERLSKVIKSVCSEPSHLLSASVGSFVSKPTEAEQSQYDHLHLLAQGLKWEQDVPVISGTETLDVAKDKYSQKREELCKAAEALRRAF